MTGKERRIAFGPDPDFARRGTPHRDRAIRDGNAATEIGLDCSGIQAKRIYLPTLALSVLTGCLVALGASRLHRLGMLSSSIGASRAELAGPPVFAFVLLVLVFERCWPAEHRRLLARGHLLDACYFVLFVLVMAPFVMLLGVASAELLQRYAPWLVIPGTSKWPRWSLVIVALAAMDGCNWLTHLADHRFGALWRVHMVHHSQEELGVLTTFRVHPLVHTASFAVATVPVVALLSGSMAPALVTAYLCLGALSHANVPWRFGPLGKIFVSPAYHRLHHALEGPAEVNLGVVLVLWDVLFGRAVFPIAGTVPGRTGLSDRPSIVEQAPARRALLRVLAVQMLEPFVEPLGTDTRSAKALDGLYAGEDGSKRVWG